MDIFMQQQQEQLQQQPRGSGSSKEKEMLDTFARVLLRDQTAEEAGLRLFARDVARALNAALKRRSLLTSEDDAASGPEDCGHDTDDEDNHVDELGEEAKILALELLAALPHSDQQRLLRTLLGASDCSLQPEGPSHAAAERALLPCGGAVLQPSGDCFVHAYLVHHHPQQDQVRRREQVRHLHQNPAKRANEQILAYSACFGGLWQWLEGFGAQDAKQMNDAIDTLQVRWWYLLLVLFLLCTLISFLMVLPSLH